jgi:hypothetical protein
VKHGNSLAKCGDTGAQARDADFIPRIMHTVFLDGEAAYIKESQAPNAAFRREWRDTCRILHSRWHHMSWDLVGPGSPAVGFPAVGLAGASVWGLGNPNRQPLLLWSKEDR